MDGAADVVEDIVKALDADERIDWAQAEVRVAAQDGKIVLAGRVSRLADKRRLEDDARRVREVKAVDNKIVIDVEPAKPDNEIRRHVLDGLDQDPWVDQGAIQVAVKGGSVTLEGQVPSLLRKRLAGTIAWWVPGTRDVINNLQVTYPEPDGDDQITDACETALEKDPFVDESEVLVRAREGVVTLIGSVCSEGEKQMAEDDCWYIEGVKDVVNTLSVVPRAGARGDDLSP